MWGKGEAKVFGATNFRLKVSLMCFGFTYYTKILSTPIKILLFV
jgi:hypothetical protein